MSNLGAKDCWSADVEYELFCMRKTSYTVNTCGVRFDCVGVSGLFNRCWRDCTAA